MKFSFDIHGVIDALPKVFVFLSKAIIAAGGEVHIITGGTWSKELEQKLKDFGMVWTHHISVYDFLIESKVPIVGQIQFPDGTIQQQFADGYWDKAKADYCQKNQIDLHIDDTLIYNEHFTTPFARLWTHNGKPKASHKELRHLA